MMTIITFGPLINQFYASFPENNSYETRLQSLANAFTKLANGYYNIVSSRYSTRTVRVGTCVTAICSFLDKYKGGMDVVRSFGVMRRIYFSPGLEAIMRSEPMRFPEDVSTMVEIHQAIQGVAPAITRGLRPDLEPFIGTNFATTPAERNRYVAAMRAEAVRQGVPLDQLPAKLPDA